MNVIRNSTLVLVSMLYLSGCDQSVQKQISVSGTSSINIAPELARFNFLIEKRGKNLSKIKADVDNKAKRLVNLCKKLGIKTKDITAAEVTIEPRYNYNKNTFLGYRITRSISAVLYDLRKYSKVIEGAVKSGITNIENISLELKKETSLENQALAAAVLTAKNKAELLASMAGVRLGNVIIINEVGPANIYVRYRAKKYQSGSLTRENAVFEPGQLTVNRTVNMIYSIK